MKKVILAAIDFSDATELVVEEAANLAKTMDTKVCLYHVRPYHGEFDGYLVTPPYLSFGVGSVDVGNMEVEGPEKKVSEESSEETRQLQNWQQKLHRAQIEASALLAYGSAAHEILSEAKEQDACLIVIGSHGGGILRRMVAGNVCRGVLRYAPCPVVVVPTRAKVEDTCKIAG